jgi:hypothetical protein
MHKQDLMASNELVLRHSFNAVTHYMPLEMLNVFSLIVEAQLPVAPTCNHSLVLHIGTPLSPGSSPVLPPT